jgi:hypothetical protein
MNETINTDELMAQVKESKWKDYIREAYESVCPNGHLIEDASFKTFLDTIWEMSLTAFDIPREVQVVIDANANLFISFGTPSFVSFMNQEDELHTSEPMTLPIDCWIHTHPFGMAYFSGTDWSTIKTWEHIMGHAIVLGDNQMMEWKKGMGDQSLFYQFGQFVEEE